MSCYLFYEAQVIIRHPVKPEPPAELVFPDDVCLDGKKIDKTRLIVK